MNMRKTYIFGQCQIFGNYKLDFSMWCSVIIIQSPTISDGSLHFLLIGSTALSCELSENMTPSCEPSRNLKQSLCLAQKAEAIYTYFSNTPTSFSIYLESSSFQVFKSAFTIVPCNHKTEIIKVISTMFHRNFNRSVEVTNEWHCCNMINTTDKKWTSWQTNISSQMCCNWKLAFIDIWRQRVTFKWNSQSKLLQIKHIRFSIYYGKRFAFIWNK